MIGSVVYGTRHIDFVVERRPRQTLDISVSPDGLVTVVAPLLSTSDEIAARVTRRGRWIVEQQRYFAQFRPRTTPRLWVPGETHLFLGRQHRLRIGEKSAPKAVHRSRGVLTVDGVSFDDTATLEQSMVQWYRKEAREVFEARLDAVLPLFGGLHVSPTSIVVRTMSSRWASMSPAGRLSLNPLLVRARPQDIDYVLVHELAHRLEPHHGPSFWALLDQVMPDHAARKARLERMLA